MYENKDVSNYESYTVHCKPKLIEMEYIQVYSTVYSLHCLQSSSLIDPVRVYKQYHSKDNRICVLDSRDSVENLINIEHFGTHWQVPITHLLSQANYYNTVIFDCVLCKLLEFSVYEYILLDHSLSYILYNNW